MQDNNLYQEIIIDESQNPENFGTLENPDFTATDGNASCGDTITVYINLSEDQGSEDEEQTSQNLTDNPQKKYMKCPAGTECPWVKEIKWQGEGCAISKASMSLFSQKIIGKTVQEVMSMDQNTLLELIGLDSISSGRIKCLMVGLSVVCKALKNAPVNMISK